MPWQTPTLTETRRLSRDAVAAALPDIDAIPANSPARVIADNNAGLAYLCLLYLDWQSRQYLPDTAEGAGLARWGSILFGGRKAATFAGGTALATGEPGTSFPEGTQLTGTATAGTVFFETTAETTIGETTTAVQIRALDPGATSNLPAGTTLSFDVGISGVDGTLTVQDALTGGTDAESDDDLRTRVLLRLRRPPMGGDADDYVAWALSFPGVTRAWCAAQEMGIGTVTVRFMMDDLRADLGGFPTSVDCAALAAYLEERRPVTARDCFVVAPLPQPVSFRLRGLVPSDPATVANIEAGINTLLMERAAPSRVEGGVRQGAQTIYAAWLNEAVSAAVGVDHFTPITEDQVMPSNGHMAVLQGGSIILG